MSRNRFGWWAYVKDMIRRYPQLKEEYDALHQQSMTADMSGLPHGGGSGRTTETIAVRQLPACKQREMDAVARAVEKTKLLKTGADRLKIIDLVFWRRSHTLEGAAMQIPCSYRQARRYHSEFILNVATEFGLLDK